MLCFPNAKINLGLHVVERRSDKFHNIETVFYPIGLSDMLEFVVNTEQQFSQSGLQIDGKASDNLVMRAYAILHRDFPLYPLHVHLHKHIPFGAGLGGGSADAAFMLKMLNNDFELHLSSEQLMDYARELGSDCAFFINNKPVYAHERGDQFQPITIDLRNWSICLVNPGIHVPTAEAYTGLTPKKPKYSLHTIMDWGPTSWREYLHNDFEQTVFAKQPQIEQLKTQLYKSGAVYAAMSGSGSSVFGLFAPDTDMPSPSIFGKHFVWQQKL